MTSSPSGMAAALVVRPAERPGLRLQHVMLWPLSRGDMGTVTCVFAQMSDQARHFRYLAATPRLTPSMLRRLADVDHESHGCWVATVDGTPVGLGRYVRTGASVAEVAFEVVDRMHGRGLGRLLVDVVMAAAVERGLAHLEWFMDPGNTAVVGLARSYGDQVEVRDGVMWALTAAALPTGLDTDLVRHLARQARARAATSAAA